MECNEFERLCSVLLNNQKNLFTITHEDMTRFNITLKEGVELVIFALNF